MTEPPTDSVPNPPVGRAAAPDPLLASARREGVVVLVAWLAALAYTVTYCVRHGASRPADQLALVFGFPDWVFWGIVAPWSVCLLFSWWFSYRFMVDADLGEELPAPGEATGAADGGQHG